MIKGTQAWIDYLDQVELPVLSWTMRNIIRITSSKGASRKMLSDAISADPDLATNVLKLSNTVTYNPSSQLITSIARAITVIGFDTVKSMAVTAMVVEQMTQKKQKEELFRCLCKAVHAANQSRWITENESQHIQEAVFVASLLHNIGETAFWASNHPLSDQLHEKSSDSFHLSVDEQRAALGTTFNKISRGLVKNWRLSPLIDEALDTPKTNAARMVRCAIAIADNTEKGWPDGTMEATARMIGLILKVDDEQIISRIKQCRQSTIPLVEKLAINNGRHYLCNRSTSRKKPIEANADIQLQILQQLMNLSGDAKLNECADLVLQGLHKGAGFERTALFIARSNTTRFQCYQFIGVHTESWKTQHFWELAEKPEHQRLLQQSMPVHIKLKGHIMGSRDAVSAPYQGEAEAMAVPLTLAPGLTGILYADRCGLAPICEKQQASFQMFFQQIRIYQQLNNRSNWSALACV